MEFCLKFVLHFRTKMLVSFIQLYFFGLFISIQFGKKESSVNEDANDEDGDPENMLEKPSDHDLVDRAKKAGVGEEHESSDEEQMVKFK